MQIRQIPGKDLFEGMVATAKDAGLGNGPMHWHVQTEVPGFVHAQGGIALEQFLNQPQVGQIRTMLSENPFVSITTFTINNAQGQPVLHYSATPDALVGTFTLHSTVDNTRQLALVKSLRTHFKVFANSALVDAARRSYETSGVKQREIAVATLESHLRQLAEYLEKSAKDDREWQRNARTQLDREYAEQRQKLQAEHDAKKALLESQLQASTDELNRKHAEHDQRVKEFETQEAKYVRRKLLTDINQVLAESQKPELSAGTRRKRYSVHGAVWALELVAGSVLATVLNRLAHDGSFDWHLSFPLAASLTTMVSTFVYYIRWLDRSFREHADLEFQAARYKADMLRASWIAELSTETYKLGDGAKIPPELLEALTRSLFKANVAGPSEHPFEQLMSAVKRGTEVSINKEGVSLKAAAPDKK